MEPDYATPRRRDFTLADIWWIYALSQGVVFAVAALLFSEVRALHIDDWHSWAIIALLLISPVVLILLVVLFASAKGRLGFILSKLTVKPWRRTLFWGVVVGVLARLLGGFVLYLEERYNLTPVIPNNPFLEQLSELTSPPAIALAAFGIIILGPVAEELFYRAVMIRVLRQYVPDQAALAISALIFGVVHFNLGLLLPLSITGYLLGLVYLLSNSLVPAMIAHGLFNAVAVFAALMVR